MKRVNKIYSHIGNFVFEIKQDDQGYRYSDCYHLLIEPFLSPPPWLALLCFNTCSYSRWSGARQLVNIHPNFS